MKAFIAPVNHNNLSEHMVIDIGYTMMGDYCGSDNSHMQEMGDEAGVIVGWNEGAEVNYFEQLYTCFSNWNIMTDILLCFVLDKQVTESEIILQPMNPQHRSIND